MPITTGCEFGDVVLVPFPFTDQTTTKKRPAAGVGEVAVERWKEAGLLKPSVLKPLLATVEKGLVIRVSVKFAWVRSQGRGPIHV